MDPYSAWQKWELEAALAHQERACDGCSGDTDTGTRRLEHWVGKSSDEIDRGGRRRKESPDRGPGGNGGCEVASGAAAWPWPAGQAGVCGVGHLQAGGGAQQAPHHARGDLP